MEQIIKKCELELIWGKPPKDTEFAKELTYMKDFWEGNYNLILESDLVENVFSNSPSHNSEKASISDILSQNLVNYSKHNSTLPKQLELLCIGIASLQAFLQSNWTGPKYNPEKNGIFLWLAKCVPQSEQVKSLAETIASSLTVDGEGICSSVLFPELLLLAETIFNSSVFDIPSVEWWLMRCLYIHQQILDEYSPTLQEKLFKLANNIAESSWVVSDNKLQSLLCLEVARIHLHYGHVNVSEKEICSSLKLLNLEVNLIGAMGKRTQYQTKELSQLTIKLNVDSTVERNEGEGGPIVVPKDITLEDDVQLPQIAFSNKSDGDFPDLTPLEQATLVSVFVQKKKSQAKDKLQKEELMPYLRCVLSRPKVWSIQLAALLFRSRLECDHRRTIERALVQMQALMNCDTNPTPIPYRFHLFYCSYAPPQFVIASECASILFSVGSVQSALDIYLDLQMWEEVIVCYNNLNLRHKSAEVIKEQLKKGETVKLLCFLGDATDGSCLCLVKNGTKRASPTLSSHCKSTVSKCQCGSGWGTLPSWSTSGK